MKERFDAPPPRHRVNEVESIIERLDHRMARLMERFPDRIREDKEYFIYDVVDKDGHPATVHIHKWERILLDIGGGRVVRVPVWEIIQAELETRHLYGHPYPLVQVLRERGIITE